MAGVYGDFLWQSAAPSGFGAQELNKMGAFVGTSGVGSPDSLTPSGTGTTMSFTIGRAIIHGNDSGSQGHYLCPMTGAATLTLPGGVTSGGQERIDWLVAKVYDDPVAIVAGGSNEWKVVAVTGTAAAVGSAVAPSLAAVTSYIPIATAKVNSSGIVSVTDQRVVSNHPSLLDASGNVRFVDKTTANEIITAPKLFNAGLKRGASGTVRGTTKFTATRSSTFSLPNINIATDSFSPLIFNTVLTNVTDDGFAYNNTTGVFTFDGPYTINGMASVKCPSGYGGVRLVTGTGVVVYQLILSQSNSPFDFLSLPFFWASNYTGTLRVEVGQQSGAAQTQPADDDTMNPVRVDVVGGA